MVIAVSSAIPNKRIRAVAIAIFAMVDVVLSGGISGVGAGKERLPNYSKEHRVFAVSLSLPPFKPKNSFSRPFLHKK